MARAPALSKDVSPFVVKLQRWNYFTWIYLAMTVGALFMLMPFLWMIVTSIKPRAEILHFPPSFFVKEPTLSSFVDLFHLIPMKRYILNSLIVAGAVTVSNLFLCSMAGYAFAKHQFWGKEKIFPR